MKVKRVYSMFLAVVLSFGTAANVLASGVSYLTDVTSEMSSSTFWTNETELLMS